MKHIVTIVGARPQFVKAASLSNKLRKKYKETLVHTGQHYDAKMSDVFFKELSLPDVDVNLHIGSAGHGAQTGKMLIELEKLFISLQPDLVLIYGDTNSTLAGALTAAKLHIPLAHIEAGLRSFNMKMPEEINRIISDRLSNLLFAPTPTAVKNLHDEGITKNVHLVGDIMYDVLNDNIKHAETKSKILTKLQIKKGYYFLTTIHRAENTNNPSILENIFLALGEIGKKIILPLHPRTDKMLSVNTKNIIAKNPNIKIIEPVGYLDMLMLEKNAEKILTDSGGVQKEAYILSIPCITLREETEWVETTEGKWNIVSGTSTQGILQAVNEIPDKALHKNIFGNGDSTDKIIKYIDEFSKK